MGSCAVRGSRSRASSGATRGGVLATIPFLDLDVELRCGFAKRDAVVSKRALARRVKRDDDVEPGWKRRSLESECFADQSLGADAHGRASHTPPNREPQSRARQPIGAGCECDPP